MHVLFSVRSPLKHPSLFYIKLCYKTFVALYGSYFSSQLVSQLKQVESFIIFLCRCLCGTEGTSLSTRMQEILEIHSQHFTHLWEGFMGSKHTPRLESFSRAKQCNAACLCLVFVLSILRTNGICYIATHLIISTPLTLFQYVSSLSETEQLLCRCSAFIYLGMERFMANIPPAKLAALSLSGTAHPHITFSTHGFQ